MFNFNCIQIYMTFLIMNTDNGILYVQEVLSICIFMFVMKKLSTLLDH